MNKTAVELCQLSSKIFSMYTMQLSVNNLIGDIDITRSYFNNFKKQIDDKEFSLKSKLRFILYIYLCCFYW